MNTLPQIPSWVDTDLYPFQGQYLKLASGHHMHYLDEGQGPTLLFVHGTPTWSFLYRDLIKSLSRSYRCVAIDHIGFGLSESPAGFSGTPQAHAQNLGEFITRMDLRDITLVVHDFGGPIGLAAGIEHADRIRKVVLFNTWLWQTQHNPDAKKIDKLINGWLGKTLYLYFNFSPKVLLKQGFADKQNLPKPVHRHYTQPFPNKISRMPLLNIAKSLVGSSDWYQQQWEQLNELADKEWLILWGMQDTFITTKYLAKWQERLPDATVKKMSCGHFVQEEKTEDVIAEIERFMR